jgi:hypothetical protein
MLALLASTEGSLRSRSEVPTPSTAGTRVRWLRSSAELLAVFKPEVH